MLRFCLFSFVALLFACSSAEYGEGVDRDALKISSVEQTLRENAERLTELERNIVALNSRIEKLEFEKLNQKDVLRNNSRETERAVPYLKSRKLNRSSTVVPFDLLDEDRATVKISNPESERALFDALNKIEEGDFSSAVSLLNESYDLAYGNAQAVLPLFWKGVTYEAMQSPKQAIAVYTEVVSKHKSHRRTANALLRQSSIFDRLGEKQLAKITLKKLITDYPNSQEAKTAKLRLND